MKKIGKILVSIIVLLLVCGGLAAYFANDWYQQALKETVSSDSAQQIFEVKKGESVDVIIANLISKKLIEDRNKLAIQIYFKLNPDLGNGIEAGLFRIAPNQTIPQIAAILQDSQDAVDIKVTIPEGLRMDEVTAILTSTYAGGETSQFSKTDFEKMITKPDDYTFGGGISARLKELKPKGKNLEGFLYPDTYFLTKNQSTQSILETLLKNFFTRYDAANIKYNNGLSFYDNLILASIVEKESLVKDNEGVAGVFLNRLKPGNTLGSDVTLLYSLKRWHPEPTAKELNSTSPYNTRKFGGLPPTPISNPGMATIINTANAKSGGPYFFFIADKDGNIRYAKTLSEHNANIRTYL